MRVKGPGYKKSSGVEGENHLEHDVRRCVSSALSQSEEKIVPKRHPPGKKKKEKENVVTPEDCDPVVCEVVEDTRAAVEDMMKELNNMVEQSTPPPQFTLTNVYDTSERKSFPPSVDTMVCPCHDVRLEAQESQKGWPYVKCPIQPCLLFCGQDQAPDYMKAVYTQPHPEVLDMWGGLQCFCRIGFMTIPQKKQTNKLNRRCPAVMLKGIPNVEWTSQDRHLEGKRIGP